MAKTRRSPQDRRRARNRAKNRRLVKVMQSLEGRWPRAPHESARSAIKRAAAEVGKFLKMQRER